MTVCAAFNVKAAKNKIGRRPVGYRFLFRSFFVVTLTFPTIAIGSESGTKAGTIYSTAHVGYAIESDSSTGFRNAGGSMMIFDVSYGVGSAVDMGLRTAGTGAELDGAKFYRMGAGPMVRVRATERLAFVLAGLRFQETGMAVDDKKQAYGSSGNSLMLSWERSHKIGSRVEVAWGGFVSQYWGGFQPTAGTAAITNARFASIERNVGMSRGIEFALRTAL